MAGGLD